MITMALEVHSNITNCNSKDIIRKFMGFLVLIGFIKMANHYKPFKITAVG